MPTHGPLFVALLIGSILLIGVLTYVPALALGPVVEHFMLAAQPNRRVHHVAASNCRCSIASSSDRRLLESVKKLDPRVQWRNPVMFVVYIGTIVTAILYGQALAGHGEAPAASFSPSPSGCCSRCCSPILPKRWPRAAAAPRRPRCATCARP